MKRSWIGWMLLVTVIMVVVAQGISTGRAAAAKITLEFWHGVAAPQATEYLNQLIGEWNSQNPDVQVRAFAIRPWAEMRTKFLATLAAGNPPDIVYSSAPYLTELIELGTIAPLDDLFGKAFFDSYLPAVNTMHTFVGHIWAIPFEGPTWGVFYRPEAFADAGLNPDRGPATWDELLGHMDRLQTARPQSHALAFPAKAWEVYEYWIPFVHQAGGSLARYDETGRRWVSELGGEGAQKGTEFWLSLAKSRATPPPTSLVTANWESIARGFVDGKYAIIFDGMWARSLIQQSLPAASVRSAIMPAGPAGRGVLGFPVALTVVAASPRKQESARFLKWLLTGERHNRLAALVGTMSWRTDFAETEYASDPVARPFIQAARYAFTPPQAPVFASYRDAVLWPTLQQILLGERTVKDALQFLDNDFNRRSAR